MARWSRFEAGPGGPRGGIAISLLIVAGVVLVRTVVSFLDDPDGYPASFITALDGILVVIVLVDILHTVIAHLTPN